MPDAALRVQSRVWRWILVLGPMLVIAIAFWSLWTLREASTHPDADDMSVDTDRVARLVDAYITRVVGVTSYLAITPDVVNLARTSSARPLTKADADAEASWKTLAGEKTDPFISIQAAPVSAFLRDLTAGTNGAYREIFLVDVKGRVIAASNRTENYQQSKDSWWPADLTKNMISCRRLPLDCAHISDVDWDPSAGVFGYDVVLPVVTPEGNAVGVLKAVVDPKELEGLLSFAEFNRDLDVELINANGTQIFSSEPFLGKEAVRKLRDLTPGSEGSLALGDSRKEGPVMAIRRLSSPVAGGWFIAVAGQHQGDAGLWKTYFLWCLFTLGMFLIAAGAFAVRIPTRPEASEERATA